MPSRAAEDYRYAAFISYRHVERDRKWAQWLHGALESFRTPRPLVARGTPARIGRVFRDEEELPASADLSSEIDEALAQSRYLVVVCSTDTPKSRWVNQEILRFRELGRHDQIVALIVDGTPETAFPPALVEMHRTRTLPDGSIDEVVEPVEPLAADVRPSRNEPPAYLKRMAKLRICACVLGCRFDDLRRREAERRRRRLLGAGAALLVMIGVLSAALVFAVRQRDRAVREREIANQERDRADKQRARADREREEADKARERAVSALASADTMLEFVTEDLLGSVDPRTSRGRDVTVREVLDDAAELVGKRFGDRPAIEAAVRRMLGRVYLGIARYEEAREHLDRALKLFTEVEGPETLAVAQTMEYLAATLGVGSDADHRKGLEYAKTCADIREKILGKAHPLSMRARMDEQMYMAIVKGDLPPGVASEPILLVFAKIRNRGETVEDVRKEVIRLIFEIERMWRAQELDKIKALAEHEAKPFMENKLFAERVPYTWAGFASSLQAAGRPDAARGLVYAAVELSRKHFGEAHPSTQIAVLTTGNVLYAQGKLKEASTWFADALRLRRKTLGEDNPATLLLQEQYGGLLYTLGRYEETEKIALDLYARRARLTPENADALRALAQFFVRLYTDMKRPDDVAVWEKRAR